MAVFTKIVIMRVFEELLAFKQLDKITVKDITDKCGISRNTFYYHYQDIYQVFQAYIDYSLNEIFKFLQQEKEKDQDHICEKAVEYLENHRTIFENLRWGDKTASDEERVELFKECQKMLTDDAAAVWICDPNAIAVTRSDLKGYTFYPVSFIDLSKLYYEE